MEQQGVQLSRWIEVAKECVAEVSESSLSAPVSVSGEPPPGSGLWGSLVALVSGNNVTCVGISSTPEGCRTLAGAMLGMEPADAADLSHDDVRDSIGELVNILAGAMKTKLSNEDPALTLGLPLFIDGMYESDSRSLTANVVCDVGETRCVLTVLVGAQQRRQAA